VSSVAPDLGIELTAFNNAIFQSVVRHQLAEYLCCCSASSRVSHGDVEAHGLAHSRPERVEGNLAAFHHKVGLLDSDLSRGAVGCKRQGAKSEHYARNNRNSSVIHRVTSFLARFGRAVLSNVLPSAPGANELDLLMTNTR
jgi:hypothetical protein